MLCSAEQNGIYLSVVAPAHNEADNLGRLIDEVTAVASGMKQPWEVVIVNDGSTDQTESVLRARMQACPQLRVLSMKGRCGQTAAVEAGLRVARGRFVAMMDADLQNDPADLPAMLERLARDECDMVNGWRRDRQDPWIRLVSTRIANRVRNWLTHETIRDYNGMHRFLPTLVKMEGFRVVEVPVRHRPRTAGKAKYGVLNRVFRALRDAFAVRWMQSRTVRYEFTEWER
jgi:dolichol-phosphate mannosyltransferase